MSSVNLFTGRMRLKPAHFGLTYHNLPASLQDSDLPITCDAVRSWDYTGGSPTLRPRWDIIEPNAPVNGRHAYVWDQLDALVGYHARFGRKVLVTPYGCPRWDALHPDSAGGYGPGVNSEPKTWTNWKLFCQELAARYRGRLLGIEMPNEPNNPRFWAGSLQALSLAHRFGAQGARAGDPGITIVSSAPTYMDGAAPNGCDYLRQMLTTSDGAGDILASWVDVIAVHMYPRSFGAIAEMSTVMLPQIRAAMAYAGCANLPLWNTEFGMLSPMLTNMGTDQQQAAIWRMLCAAAAHAAGGVARSFMYSADGPAAAPCSSLAAPSTGQIFVDQRAILMSGDLTSLDLLDGATYSATIAGTTYAW